MIVSDPARGKEALTAAKFRVSEEPAVLLSLDNRPGALASVTEKLGQAKMNIKCAYATTSESGRASVVLVVSNPDKALSLVGG